MEIGYIAKRTLIPAIMQSVAQSRMHQHLPSDTIFVSWYGADTIQFNLAKLSLPYKQKHVYPDLSGYSTALLQNLTPGLELWCRKNNIKSLEMDFCFRTEKNIYLASKTVKTDTNR